MIWLYSFLFAGIMCAIGETIYQFTKLSPGHITSIYVIAGVFLDSFNIYDFFIKVVLKDLDAYNRFVFEKLTKVHGIVKMQSSFVLSEIKHTTVLNIDR